MTVRPLARVLPLSLVDRPEADWHPRTCAACGSTSRAPIPAPPGWRCEPCTEREDVERWAAVRAEQATAALERARAAALDSIPETYRHCSRSTWREQGPRGRVPWPSDQVDRFVAGVLGGSPFWALVIVGRDPAVPSQPALGCGKTHLGTAVFRDLVGRMANPAGALWVGATDAHEQRLREQRADRNAELTNTPYPVGPGIAEQLERAPLLLLDDLGQQADTDGARRLLTYALTQRFNRRLPTILPCNYPSIERLAEWDGRLGDRLYERTVPVVLTGSSRRRPT